ncbi:MAG: phytanoyl-CoA dioxygenase family protein [Candidatus Puniceispirillum sp.]|jgi:phytanoyl-CoA hydroxylase|uniref:phytanoyl-CoA dioxygenase family protein n=1 Tax=Candidatus Puniceispirillum sp. TaxID=2026719 RepID=UPI001EB1416E|nr:phytanoyl-CoA dioxygenase family protein [Candidatus Puniceispirillum sp.]MBT6416631.1 phytanoyl-CoA dioxygenase family protein [Candidatus Puniceispirillum sp.]
MDWATAKAEYDRDGFYVIDNLLCSDEIDALITETAQICRGARGAVRGIEESKHLLDDDLDDNEILSRVLTIQFPHKVSPMIRDNYIAHPRIAEAMSYFIGPNVKAMQSMLFIKPSGKPGQAWHQDEHFIPTRDCSLTGLWIALDDATIENGCLWVRPGSHKDRVIYNTAPHGSKNFDEGNQLVGTPDDDDDGVPVEVKRGSAIVFNGYIHHRSLPNKAKKGTFRRSLVNHYMNANSLLPWDWDGRIVPTRDMRDIMLVCGVDPYSWKGTDDITFAFLRAETANDKDPNHDTQKKVF